MIFSNYNGLNAAPDEQDPECYACGSSITEREESGLVDDRLYCEHCFNLHKDVLDELFDDEE